MPNPVLIAQAVAVGIDALLKIYEAIKDDVPEKERGRLGKKIDKLRKKIGDDDE